MALFAVTLWFSSTCVHSAEPLYKETVLAEHIAYEVDVIKERLSKKFKESPGKYADVSSVPLTETECPEIIMLGWYIVAAGEHSDGSESLKSALFRVKNEVGFLAVPYWVGWEERREAVVEFYRREKSLKEEDVDPFEGLHLFWLAQEAMQKIANRTGYKFEGYRGFEMISYP